ncbi:hypothetical protein [Okeania sp. SIO2B3]|uniref:hypothetical protein n=1 Tax=Okeania sp. SIO2B3 TaxID=2607784 RepID=UPI0013BF17BD|nr:hypothetical protein [Okeania sp. SIO2B3]NET40865.1 hypothetical protein [Okeania sp. SIO2B3]
MAFLGAISALSTNSVAQAAILWDWSFGGTETVRSTTDGDISDLGSANTFIFTDFEVLASMESSLVGADFINDPLTIIQGQQGFVWDGSQITQLFRNGSAFTNGTNFHSGDFRYTFVDNFSQFSDKSGLNIFASESAFTPTPSAPTTPGPNLQPAPEPATLFGLLTFGAVALGSRYQRSK